MDYVEKRINFEKKAISDLISSQFGYKASKVTYTVYKGLSTQKEFKELILSVLRDIKKNYSDVKILNEKQDTLIDFSDDQITFRIYLDNSPIQ